MPIFFFMKKLPWILVVLLLVVIVLQWQQPPLLRQSPEATREPEPIGMGPGPEDVAKDSPDRVEKKPDEAPPSLPPTLPDGVPKPPPLTEPETLPPIAQGPKPADDQPPKTPPRTRIRVINADEVKAGEPLPELVPLPAPPTTPRRRIRVIDAGDGRAQGPAMDERPRAAGERPDPIGGGAPPPIPRDGGPSRGPASIAGDERPLTALPREPMKVDVPPPLPVRVRLFAPPLPVANSAEAESPRVVVESSETEPPEPVAKYEPVQTSHWVRMQYATDRRPTADRTVVLFQEDRPYAWYSGDWDGGALHYGAMKASVRREPVGVVKAAVNAVARQLATKDVFDDHVVTLSEPKEAASEAAFLEGVRAQLARSQTGDVLVFVHGFNTTFAEAARRLAQFVYDAEYQGTPVLFSWSSLGSGKAYGADNDRVKSASHELSAFLERLLASLPPDASRRVTLLAHSLGHEAVVEALQDMQQLRETEAAAVTRLRQTGATPEMLAAVSARPNERLPLFNEVVMVAADVSRDTFYTRCLQPVKKAGLVGRFTLYACAHDVALWSSGSVVHKGARLGEVDAQGRPYVCDGMDSVDVTPVASSRVSLNHWHLEVAAAVRDAADVILRGKEAGQRSLKRMGPATGGPGYFQIEYAPPAVP